MTLDDLTGEKLVAELVAQTESQVPDSSRDSLYRALLAEPVALLHVGPGAPAGPSVTLGTKADRGQSELTRLVEAPALRVPVVPVYASAAALRRAAEARGLWPDAVERAIVVAAGEVFALLKGHPGALVVADAALSVPLDAGEVAALGEKQTPGDYATALRTLVNKGRAREAARRIATRPLYVLGHPRGGMLLVQRDLPAFFHLAEAERFAARIAAQTGERAEHGLVAAADLFKHAWAGRLNILINPGPGSISLRPVDLR